LKTLIIVLVVLVVLAGLGGLGFVALKRNFSNETTETKVRVEPAARGSLVEVVSVPGEIQPRRKVSISPRVSARIVELYHAEGDEVEAMPPAATQPTKKNLLVRLDSKDLEAALKSVSERAAAQESQIEVEKLRIEAQKEQLRASKAVLDDAERDMHRKTVLAEKKDVPVSEAETAKAKYDELTANYEAAKHTLLSEQQNLIVLQHQKNASEADIDKAKEELSYTIITSTINGVITKQKTEVGEQVVPGIQGSLGSTILEVADFSQMLMVARIDEANIIAVKPGQKATVRIQAYRNRTFQGVVESVALAKADPNAMGSSGRNIDSTNYYECKILLTRPPDITRIPTGLNADADIETSRHDGVKVPSQAVVGRAIDTLPADVRDKAEKDKSVVSVVYRYINGKAIATPVKVGASDDTHTVILEGLKEGDPVITGPYKALDTLQNDQVVSVEATPAKGTPASKPAATMPATAPTTQPSTSPATKPAKSEL
jgi:HlyD family secretion protein